MENNDNKTVSEVPFETNDEICQKLVEEFVLFTDTDEALAQFYLQERNWNLTNSVNDYFDEILKQNKLNKRKFIDLDNNDSNDSDIVIISQTNKSKAKSEIIRVNTNETEPKASSSSNSISDDFNGIRFITWNIDGLDQKNKRLRIEAVSNAIKCEKAIIVFLQEVIPFTEQFLRERLPSYEFFSGDKNGVEYYTLTLIHKSHVKLESNEVIDFEESAKSSMGRNLLKTRVKVRETYVTLFNTHLESTKEFADIRMAQLRQTFKLISDIPQTDTVIFAGDLNLRDTELSNIGGLPLKVKDVWEETGRRKEVEYTWDMRRNDNLQFCGQSKFKPKLRFDRVYIRECTPAKMDAIHFGLIGLQRLKPHVCFPSDHWGIRALFSFI